MIFLSSQFSQTCKRVHETLWSSTPLTEPEVQLLQYEHQVALRFYSYIRLHRNEKITILELVDIGIPIDNIFELFLLIYLLQGQDSIEMFVNSDITYIVYRGEK